MFTFKVPYTFPETYGTGTLVGTLGMQPELHRKSMNEWEHIHLLFTQPTLGWCRENKGPYEQIVTSHLLYCFLGDILALQNAGVKITYEVIEENP